MRVLILGSTGSIGTQTLDVISRHPDKFQVTALTAHRNVTRMLAQCQTYQPQYAVMVDEVAALQLQRDIKAAGLPTEVLSGADALQQVAADAGSDVVMAAIVGAAGLLPTLAAARQGKRILLANKEALVMAGDLFVQAVREHQAELIPVDSEHNAIFQCLPAGFRAAQQPPVGVADIVLTASGGPFREYPLAKFDSITPQQAVAHPNWSMGAKVSVDSATMMNKGLEVIEAHYLFGLPAEQLKVVLHPQSIVHSMVRYHDGSMLAQLGQPDMRTPIACALSWPQRMDAGVAPLDLVAVGRLDFQPMDRSRYPCLQLAYDALQAGPAAVVALNAANEVAVADFLKGKITFPEIAAAVSRVLENTELGSMDSIEAIIAADKVARSVLYI